MSDLQCAATLLLVAHPAADPEGERSLTGAGREQARDLGRSLAGARVAVVYTSDLRSARDYAEAVAASTGARVAVRTDLDATRASGALGEIADLHRGETALVLLPVSAVEPTLSSLVGLPPRAARAVPLSGPTVVELAADGDGWTLRDQALRRW
jgi:phosphohistidine phosphatase SixA